jgi:hypothetical protein
MLDMKPAELFLDLNRHRPDMRAAVPFFLSAVALVATGCGNQSRNLGPNADKKSVPIIDYSGGIRMWRVTTPNGTETVVDLCRGTELVHEDITAKYDNRRLKSNLIVKIYKSDPKCADGTISPNDFGNELPTDTTKTI